MSGFQSFQVIDRSYLRNMVFKCALIFVAGFVATAVIFYLRTRQPIGPTYGEAFRMLAHLQQDIFYKSMVIYTGTALVMLAGIISVTLLYSHRVAGPVYRLGLFVNRIGRGEINSAVSLRQKDVVHPLAHEVNVMVEEYRQTVLRLNRELEELVRCSARLQAGQEKTEEIIDEIEAGAGEISRIMSKYRL